MATSLFFSPGESMEHLMVQRELMAIAEKERSRDAVQAEPRKIRNLTPHMEFLSIATLRDYLRITFENPQKNELEGILDDFILFAMLIGNDFLPNLKVTHFQLEILMLGT
jgi:5'-3' exonuclease